MKRIFFSLLIISIPFLGTAQERTFKAGLIGGFNAAQLDGDLLAGYNKFGLVAGGTVAVQIADRWRPSIEVLYTQKGSRSSADETLAYGAFTRYSIDYVEIPILMNYIDGGFMLNAGISYSRIVQLREVLVDEIDLLDIESDNFNQNNASLLAGIGFFFNDNFGVEVRYSYSPFSIVDYNNSSTFGGAYISKSLSFRTVYLF
jgi:opacity protein-like surface antigen